MPARALSTATISFGLVSIPVKLYSAAESKAALSFNQIHKKDGSRVKPEFGSVFYTMAGKDQASATRVHLTIAVPGATATSLGLPDNNKQGGAWIMNAGTSTAHIMVPGS